MKKVLTVILFCVHVFADSYAGLLFHGNCITCHDTKQNKSAPTIQAIQKAYKSAFRDKETFIKQMSQWVYDPNVQNSIMSLDIEKYGLMPHLAYDKKVLEEIAQFIYENDFDE